MDTHKYGNLTISKFPSIHELNRMQLKDLYANLKAGVYFIKISQNGLSATKKVVISE